jgi:hypothetical protein
MNIKEKSDFSQFQNQPSFKDQTCSPFSKPQNHMAELAKWRLKILRTLWKNLKANPIGLTCFGDHFPPDKSGRTDPTSPPRNLPTRGQIHLSTTWDTKGIQQGRNLIQGFWIDMKRSQANRRLKMTRTNAATCSMPCLTGRARTGRCHARPRVWSATPVTMPVPCPWMAIKSTPMHDHLPCYPLRTPPNSPELARSSGDLPVTRQSRPRATTVTKPTSPPSLDLSPRIASQEAVKLARAWAEDQPHRNSAIALAGVREPAGARGPGNPLHHFSIPCTHGFYITQWSSSCTLIEPHRRGLAGAGAADDLRRLRLWPEQLQPPQTPTRTPTWPSWPPRRHRPPHRSSTVTGKPRRRDLCPSYCFSQPGIAC